MLIGATTTDGFLLLPGVKLPDAHNVSVDRSITLEECRARCLANCSCVAYAAADIRGGDVRSGCAMWTDEIIDLRYVDHGQDLYLRLAKSELPQPPSAPRAFPTAPVVGASVAAVLVVVVLVLVLIVIRRRRGPTISGNKLQPWLRSLFFPVLFFSHSSFQVLLLLQHMPSTASWMLQVLVVVL